MTTVHGAAGWTPDDEQRHQPGPDPWWAEAWTFDTWRVDGSAGLSTAVVLFPNRRRAWYWSSLVRADAPLVHVVDLDLAPRAAGLLLRQGELWADHECEAAFEQWTVRNETYGVALDEPEEALGRSLGERVPIAVDLEWYAAASPEPLGADLAGLAGYRQRGEADGVVELVGGELHLRGPASRVHWWGVRDWFAPVAAVERPAGLRAPVRLEAGDGRVAALDRVLTSAGWWERLMPLP